MICKEDFKFLYKNESGAIYNIRTGKIKFGEEKEISKINQVFEQYLNSELSIKDQTDFEEYINLTFGKEEKPNGFSYNRGLDNTKSLSRLEIMLCNSCNLKCKYCYANEGTYGSTEAIANPEIILNSLVSLIPHKYNHIKTIMFFGWKPLLNTETIRITCELFQKNLR